MTLPVKCLNVLAALKAELLSPKVSEPEPVVEVKREKKPTQRMRHARVRGESWQRYKRQGGW